MAFALQGLSAVAEMIRRGLMKPTGLLARLVLSVLKEHRLLLFAQRELTTLPVDRVSVSCALQDECVQWEL